MQKEDLYVFSKVTENFNSEKEKKKGKAKKKKKKRLEVINEKEVMENSGFRKTINMYEEGYQKKLEKYHFSDDEEEL